MSTFPVLEVLRDESYGVRRYSRMSTFKRVIKRRHGFTRDGPDSETLQTWDGVDGAMYEDVKSCRTRTLLVRNSYGGMNLGASELWPRRVHYYEHTFETHAPKNVATFKVIASSATCSDAGDAAITAECAR